MKKKIYKYKCDLEESSEEEELNEDFKRNIKKIGNKIFYYSNINIKDILYLKELLYELEKELLINSLKYSFDPIIELHINSDGGCLFTGIDIYNFINNFSIPINTYTNGFIASAATFMFLAGKKRYMYENNYLLIHQLSTGAWGTYEILKDEMNNNKKLMNTIIDLYKKYTYLPKNKLNEMLKNEIYLNSNDCIKYNFATNLI